MLINLLFCLIALGGGSAHARITVVEPWVDVAAASFARIYPGFLDGDYRAVDEGLLLEVQRLNALIASPRARQNFQNLLTKIWVTPSNEHLSRYVAHLGTSPAKVYPYYHGIEFDPRIVRRAVGRSLLMYHLQHGFDRVTGFARAYVPGTSITAIQELRARRAEIAFLRRYVPAEQRRGWMADLVAGGDAGFRDVNVKFYRRLAAADGDADAERAVMREVFGPTYRARIACELGLARAYDPELDRDRLLTSLRTKDGGRVR